MGSSEIAIDAFPFLRLYKNGTVERLAGTAVAPSGLDSETGVLSKDVVFNAAATGVSARLYHPCAAGKQERLPLAVYFHGGGFFISSTADPVYHRFLNNLAAESNCVVVSVDYRLAPENPLPAAFDDCWSALCWIGSGATNESWIDDDADLNRVILLGDSAGANIAHHMICRYTNSNDSKPAIKIASAAMVHPYFWGNAPLPSEIQDSSRRAMVDCWWSVACSSEKGNDDPLINPFVVGAPSLDGLRSCERIVVVLAGNDILRERGWVYYDTVLKSELCKGKIEVVESEGEDHIFHILAPHKDEARKLLKFLADFVSSS